MVKLERRCWEQASGVSRLRPTPLQMKNEPHCRNKRAGVISLLQCMHFSRGWRLEPTMLHAVRLLCTRDRRAIPPLTGVKYGWVDCQSEGAQNIRRQSASRCKPLPLEMDTQTGTSYIAQRH